MTASIAFETTSIDLGGRTILDAIDFTVTPGTFVSIVGASGSGKTTLLRLAAGLYLPTRGSVRIDGRVVSGPDPAVAIVFQDYGRALLPWRTAAGNVSLALEAIGLPKARRPDR
ncbi:MAG TPA: ATP-binding cassette domain-containing protein, partial [Beijerinckiaceae bacterium]|nr:ATP-binding cassette domain-containing protein [Beijerinckiaceae bacterium]